MCLPRLFALCLLLSICVLITAQTPSPNNTAFTVTAVAATSGNPWFGNALAASGGFVYAINGVGAAGAATLSLYRGYRYTFDSSQVYASHPFYITTDSTGAGAGTTIAGPQFSGTTLVYIPDPSGTGTTTYYYQCDYHPHMGGIITITSPPAPPAVSSSSTAPPRSSSSTSSPISSSSISSTSIISSSIRSSSSTSSSNPSSSFLTSASSGTATNTAASTAAPNTAPSSAGPPPVVTASTTSSPATATGNKGNTGSSVSGILVILLMAIVITVLV